MRWFVLGLLLLPIVSQPARAQVRTEARGSVSEDLTLPRWKVTLRDGRVFLAVEYVTKGTWHVFTDIKGNKSTFAASAVKSIEPLPEAEAEQLLDEAPPEKLTSPRNVGPRVEARTDARVVFRGSARITPPVRKPRRPPPQMPSQPYIPEYVPSSAGYSATGLPLHVGPRGGIYHISKNGNKVYHSRSK